MAGADPAAIARKLGYPAPADLALHLPLRYEDETRLTPIAQARVGETVQVEGVVVRAEVRGRPRRQLVVEVVEAPGAGEGGALPERLGQDPAFQDALAFARQLRRLQTDAENLIWSLLRAHQMKGAKFRRQHPIGPYFLDFYCPEIRLAIELDGGQHMDRSAQDRQRTDWLARQDVTVLRFWNNEVLTQTETVLSAIWNAIPDAAGEARPLSPGPSPHGGGGTDPLSPGERGRGEGGAPPGRLGQAPAFQDVRPAAARLFFRLLHFYPSQVTQLQPGARVRLLGEVRAGFLGAEMVHPRFRLVRDDTPLPRRLTPVYPTVAGVSQHALRQAVAAALAAADRSDSLPAAWPRRLGLPAFDEAIDTLHQPPPGADLAQLDAREHPAWRRLKFDELLAQQLSLRLAARQRRALAAPTLDGDGGLTERLLAGLPFPLTGAQRRVLAEIRADLARPHPMNRLLQGDVGSGKTLVAALALLPALAAGGQAAVMAPTEILAEQLWLKLGEWLTPLGIELAWLAAALKGKARRQVLAGIADGRVRVAVGTHALFQTGVAFHDLVLAVVDEQHRFGVAQRLALRAKGARVPGDWLPAAGSSADPQPASGHSQPHLLMMSATPIPRSLAMSHYADLDVSVIDELPPGRSPIATRVMPDTRRDEVIGRLRDYCRSGAQAYWVCPLVEESEKLQLRAARDCHAELVAQLPGLAIGLVHGRMKAEEKAAVMAAFKAGELHLLVATTVIEVGVDVPNAALMVIEHAERYGLAQLHQLRGRVGRGARESACLLMYGTPLSDAARARLRILRAHADGFAIAREDLRLRGPGEFLGARQSGQAMLRFADLERDQDLLAAARDAAQALLAGDPAVVRRHLARWLPHGLDFLRA